MTLEFNPNKKPQQPSFATYTPRRKPTFKVHRLKSHAKSAMLQHTPIIMYEWISVGENSAWAEVNRLEEHATVCTNCGISTLMNGKYTYNTGRVSFIKGTDRIANLCYECVKLNWKGQLV